VSGGSSRCHRLSRCSARRQRRYAADHAQRDLSSAHLDCGCESESESQSDGASVGASVQATAIGCTSAAVSLAVGTCCVGGHREWSQCQRECVWWSGRATAHVRDEYARTYCRHAAKSDHPSQRVMVVVVPLPLRGALMCDLVATCLFAALAMMVCARAGSHRNACELLRSLPLTFAQATAPVMVCARVTRPAAGSRTRTIAWPLHMHGFRLHWYRL
jgi:hypothetical protein